MASALTRNTARHLRDRVATLSEDPQVEELNYLLRTLAMWRARALANTYIAHEGARVMSGPFAGMEYVSATEGSQIARLLGVYEAGLHPHLHAFAAEGLDCLIDVGCAEGYYAVGLARMMPELTVYAYDISEAARTACATLAARNGVTDRVIIGGEFKPDGFEAFAGRRALVMVDAEGAELDILQPALSPSLAGMNVIVETHDVFRPGSLETLIERFSPTHSIVQVGQGQQVIDMPPWLASLSQLDQLLAIWEWRLAETPWLVMRPKSG
ncbi:MAG: hypothetical protein ACREE0_18420 [Phenylobacterium sp.]